MDFREQLSEYIMRLGITQRELAKALSYDASHISKILSGARRPGHPAPQRWRALPLPGTRPKANMFCTVPVRRSVITVFVPKRC